MLWVKQCGLVDRPRSDFDSTVLLPTCQDLFVIWPPFSFILTKLEVVLAELMMNKSDFPLVNHFIKRKLVNSKSTCS